MTEAFQRIVQVHVGPPGQLGKVVGNKLDGSPGLHVKFSTKNAATNRPSECELSIWNLAEDTIDLFSKSTNVVTVTAGYATTGTHEIFVGNPTRDTLRVRKSRGDWITTVTLRDGGQAYDHGRLEVSLLGEVTPREVLNEIKAQTGLGEGQVDLGGFTWPRRYVWSGSASSALDDLAQSISPEHRWFIRDEKIFILGPNDVTAETAPVFSNENGTLTGSVEPVEGGGVRFTGVLDATVRVGRKVRLESRRITGWFKVIEMQFSGDNFGGPFSVAVKGVRYDAVEEP